MPQTGCGITRQVFYNADHWSQGMIFGMTATILPFSRPLQDAVMAVHSLVPQGAMTAELLGLERNSHAVQVSADGLLLTVGYSVLEASEIWLTNRKGQTCEAVVLAQDYDSGLALLKPLAPIGLMTLPTASVDALTEDSELRILASGEKELIPVELFAIEEFAGRWEYLLERALYTMPLYERWSGAALIDGEGRLLGLGSLALGLRNDKGEVTPGNLFIPVELVMPHLDHLREHGQKPGKLRPWLGALVEEHESGIYVVGLYNDAPAARAGLKPGDLILSVGQQPVSSMAGFFRTLWNYGPAGTAIPLTLREGPGTREIMLATTDRNSFFMRHTAGQLN
jgi:S1-C subfamily serine protease